MSNAEYSTRIVVTFYFSLWLPLGILVALFSDFGKDLPSFFSNIPIKEISIGVAILIIGIAIALWHYKRGRIIIDILPYEFLITTKGLLLYALIVAFDIYLMSGIANFTLWLVLSFFVGLGLALMAFFIIVFVIQESYRYLIEKFFS